MEGKLHRYSARKGLNLFEYTPRSSQATLPPTTPANIILFIGGLYDNFSNPEYLVDLAQLFPRHQSQQWALMHVQLSSALVGFGTSELAKDIEEIATAVTYIRDTIREGRPTNVVLLGWSTGCQDALHYISAPYPSDTPRPIVQGVILQAPVSDRDAVMKLKVDVEPSSKECFDRCMSLIATVPESDHKSYILPMNWTRPLFGKSPLCISRFLDLASPSSPDNPRTEDLFSSDLHESRLNQTFGKVGSSNILSKSRAPNLSILILISQSDEIVSKPLGADDMLRIWGKALLSCSAQPVKVHPESKLIKNAKHDISGSTPGQQRARLVDFRKAVLKYIDDAVGGVDEIAWAAWEEGAKRVAELEKSHDGVVHGVGDLKL